MQMTMFEHSKQKIGKEISISWEKFINTKHDIRSDKEGLLFLPGTSIDNSRKKEKVKKLSFLVFDIDTGKLDDNLLLLQKYRKYEYFLYTSHNHSVEQCKYRVVFPLKDPIDVSEYARIHDQFSVNSDVKAREINRVYYLPSSPGEGGKETHHNKGEFFNPTGVQIREAPTVSTTNLPQIQLAVLQRVAKILSKNSSDPVRSVQWSAILKGESFSLQGDRHNSLIGLCFQLVNRIQGTPESLAKIFEKSLDNMKYPISDCLAALKDSLEKVLIEKKELEDSETQDIAFARPDEKTVPYNETDFIKMRVLHDLSKTNLQKHLIIYKNKACYFLSNKGYLGPFEKENLQPLSVKYLAPFQKKIFRKKDNLLAVPAILAYWGAPAVKILADVTIQESFYDSKNKILHEATAKACQEVKAVYHEDVHEWLKEMGGERLLDWVSVCFDTEKEICGLYLFGATGTGKTLLAHGLARLWSGGIPTKMSEAFSDFDDRMAENPLIFADEQIPPAPKNSDTTAIIRSLIGTQARTIQRKYYPTMDFFGCLRLIFATNGNRLFQFSNSIDKEGQEALAKRILYIQTKRILKRSDRILEWLNFAIAEHALWLSENRTVISGDRFYVEGDVGPMLHILNTENQNTSIICKWIIKFLKRPNLVKKYVVKDDGNLYINNQAVDDHWTDYLTDKKLSTRKITDSLKAISHCKKILTIDKGRCRYWHIDTANIIAWAETHDYMSREDIEEALK